MIDVGRDPDAPRSARSSSAPDDRRSPARTLPLPPHPDPRRRVPGRSPRSRAGGPPRAVRRLARSASAAIAPRSRTRSSATTSSRRIVSRGARPSERHGSLEGDAPPRGSSPPETGRSLEPISRPWVNLLRARHHCLPIDDSAAVSRCLRSWVTPSRTGGVQEDGQAVTKKLEQSPRPRRRPTTRACSRPPQRERRLRDWRPTIRATSMRSAKIRSHRRRPRPGARMATRKGSLIDQGRARPLRGYWNVHWFMRARLVSCTTRQTPSSQ